MELVKKRRAVIVAAGEIKNTDIIRKNVFYDDFLIAADAGFIKCIESGNKPDLLIGDFDSFDKPDTDTEIIALNPIKDCTDTEFCVNEAFKRGFSEILIIGGLGGRNDHSFANLSLLAGFKQRGVNIMLIDENHRIYALKDEACTVVNENQYVSVFAYAGNCTVTLEGFFYPLKNYILSPYQGGFGTSNELVGETGKIIISDGSALVMEVSKTI